jgi:hypothetical protein
MMTEIINEYSLSATLDNLNQIFFDKGKLSVPQKTEITKWISGRQGLKGSYWNMFAPTEADYRGIRLFTGEPLTSGASIGHILGEEASRALYLLGQDRRTNDRLRNAQSGLNEAVKRSHERGFYSEGYYCCGKCTVAYWRNLSAENADKNEKLLRAGVKVLKSLRDGKGKWRRFPFYYTLYSLLGIKLPEAREELRYASGVCERVLRTREKNGKYFKRRRKLAEMVLETA